MGARPQEELLCLRWEDFGSHFSGSFRRLRRQTDSREAFFDVSLVAGGARAGAGVGGAEDDGDDVPVQAHRVVLSSCSPFFRRVLSSHARSSPAAASGLAHPVIYLRGVSSRDLRNVLDFMYHGEVNVAQADLDAFLAVAEDLKVKGLTQAGGEGEQAEEEEEEVAKPKVEHQGGGGGGGGGGAGGGGGGGGMKRPAPPDGTGGRGGGGGLPRKRVSVARGGGGGRGLSRPLPSTPSSSRLQQTQDDEIQVKDRTKKKS